MTSMKFGSKETRRRTIAGVACVAATFGVVVTFAAPASAAAPCVTGVDYGRWDTEHSGGYVGGTWHNCGAANDRVKIVVNNASDSGCYNVAAGTQRHISYDPTFWGPGDHFRSWDRC